MQNVLELLTDQVADDGDALGSDLSAGLMMAHIDVAFRSYGYIP